MKRYFIILKKAGAIIGIAGLGAFSVIGLGWINNTQNNTLDTLYQKHASQIEACWADVEVEGGRCEVEVITTKTGEPIDLDIIRY